MGAFLDKPKTEKHTERGEGNGLRFGLSSMQGWRVEMEDAHCATIGLPNALKDWSYFAVFDGHAGARVSAICAEKLLAAILETETFLSSGDGSSGPTEDNVRSAIKSGFLRLDAHLREMPEMVNGEDKSGSTAVCCLVSPQSMFFANCGDSRGVLSRGERAFFCTEDHKPVNPAERERIQNAGGSVMIQRVNGSLAVSRALGDFEYKNVEGRGPCEQLVSPEPEVTVVERAQPDDEFLVLACDGIWDVMTNDDVCIYVRHRMRLTDDLAAICSNVVDTCLNKGSRDNMSIVIVAFENAPKPSDEAVQAEQRADEQLEKKIREILENADPGDVVLPYVMHALSETDVPGLPPGGGLAAKRQKIEEILRQIHPALDTEAD